MPNPTDQTVKFTITTQVEINPSILILRSLREILDKCREYGEAEITGIELLSPKKGKGGS